MQALEVTEAGQELLRGSGLLRVFSEMGSCWAPLLLAPGAVTLVRVWLQALAFSTNLAQESLEEVPVQPDFDAHKVSVMARPTQCWNKDWVPLQGPTEGMLQPEQRLRQCGRPREHSLWGPFLGN